MRNQEENFPTINSDDISLPSIQTCPQCKKPTPILTPYAGNPGDFGVAVCCGSAVVFDDNLELQIPKEVDWSAISADEKSSILRVSSNIQRMKKEFFTKRVCPSCGVNINVMQQCMHNPAWLVETIMGKLILPKEGDFGICSECIEVYIFGEDAKELRSATKAEVIDLTRKDEETARLLMAALQAHKHKKSSQQNLSMN